MCVKQQVHFHHPRSCPQAAAPPRHAFKRGAPRPYCSGTSPHASSGGTLRSVPSLPTPPKQSLRLRRPGAKATEGYPPRIHPRVYTRGFLRRRVKTPRFLCNIFELPAGHGGSPHGPRRGFLHRKIRVAPRCANRLFGIILGPERIPIIIIYSAPRHETHTNHKRRKTMKTKKSGIG
jgi:hypothetical protein